MRKKIFFIIGSLQLGGTEKHLVNILPQLAAQGYLVSIITLSEKGCLSVELEKKNVPVFCVLTDRDFKVIRNLPKPIGRLVRIILTVFKLMIKFRQEKVDIIHFFLPEAYILGMVAALMARFSGHKIMSRRSLNYYQQRRKGVALCEKFLHSKTTIITGNSAVVIEQLKQEKVPEERLRLIYNGINITPFLTNKSRAGSRKELGISEDALVFIVVANLIPYKGHRDLLEALSLIQDQFIKDWYLICVGRDDGILESLKEQAIQWRLSQHIKWLGSRSDVPDLLSAADIGILCSHEEGFSNAVLEGMAAGLPFVVTDVGGNKEAVIEGETGYVVPAKDPKALASAILKMANNPETASAFGQRAKKRVKEHFSLDGCVQAYIKLYKDCLTNKKKVLSDICVE